MTAIYSKDFNVFHKSYFSPCGNDVAGIDRDGAIYCYKCIPLNKSGECEEDFSISEVEPGSMLGVCCSECGDKIETADIDSLDQFIAKAEWHLTEATEENMEELYNAIYILEESGSTLEDFDQDNLMFDVDVWSLIDNYLMAGVDIDRILDLLLCGEIELFYSREQGMYYHAVIA